MPNALKKQRFGSLIRQEYSRVYGDISMTRLGEILGKRHLFRNILNQKRPFKPSELLYIAKKVHKQFSPLSQDAPQYLTIMRALGKYRVNYHWYYKVHERSMIQSLFIHGPTKSGYAPNFNSKFTRKLQNEILMRLQCGCDGFTGEKISGSTARHHIWYDKLKCTIKDLVLVSSSSHATITNYAERSAKHKQ